MMDTATVIAVGALVLSAVVGFLGYRRDRRKIDVDAAQAKAAGDIAHDESSVRLALRLRDEAIEERRQTQREIADMRAENGAYRAEVGALRDEVSALRFELSRVRRRWESWARDLHARWDYHRAQPTPPPLPEDTE